MINFKNDTCQFLSLEAKASAIHKAIKGSLISHTLWIGKCPDIARKEELMSAHVDIMIAGMMYNAFKDEVTILNLLSTATSYISEYREGPLTESLKPILEIKH